MYTYFNGSFWVAIDRQTSVVLALASTLKELQSKLDDLI